MTRPAPRRCGAHAAPDPSWDVASLAESIHRKLGRRWLSVMPPRDEGRCAVIATTKTAAVRQGELFRDVGVSIATLNRRELIDADELRFLDALATNGEGTTDDAVSDLSHKYRDGGKWRGSIPLRLAREGLIVRVGVVKSSRTHRHRGWLAVWSIRDGPAVDARRLTLRTMLAALDAARNGTGPTMPLVEPVESAITHTPNGEKNDGQVV